MTLLDGDPSLYIKEMDGDTEGLLGNYVDDNLFAETKVVLDLARQTQNTFDSKEIECLRFSNSSVATIDEQGSASFALSSLSILKGSAKFRLIFRSPSSLPFGPRLAGSRMVVLIFVAR